MTQSEKPEIIVDDDWKARVQREKEQLKNGAGDLADDLGSIPEASFALLVTTLATQTLAALGFIADPTTGQSETNRPMAKHFVDTLAVLQEKTAGNLSDDESHLLDETLHQLRMAFVTDRQSSTAEKPQSKSSIELP